MVNDTGIIPDGWIKKFPLCRLVDKAESYLRARGMKDVDDKKKDDKKQDRRKTPQIEKDKELDIQGDGRKKSPLDSPHNVPQK